MSDQLADICTAIGKLMGEVLVREPLGPDDSFFSCGGDSLRAVEVLQRLFDEHGLDDDSASSEKLQSDLLTSMFEDGTPAALTSILRSASSGAN